MKDTYKIRCIHCLHWIEAKDKTQDHIFPKSWYPESSPRELERWTAPSCKRCNENLGAMEDRLFLRMAVCINPKEMASSGISKKALRAMGIGTVVTKKEARIRATRLRKLLKEVEPFTQHTPKLFPGFGPPSGFPRELLVTIKIPAEELEKASQKIIRGLEYKLGRGRYIENNYICRVYFVEKDSVSDVDKLIDRGTKITHGPGFSVARNTSNDPKTVLYRVKIWNKLIIHASITKKNFLRRAMRI